MASRNEYMNIINFATKSNHGDRCDTILEGQQQLNNMDSMSDKCIEVVEEPTTIDAISISSNYIEEDEEVK